MKSIDRRQFLRTAAGGAGVLAMAGCAGGQWLKPEKQKVQPNILWISVEDISPDLGCYGDQYAITPNIDKFATGAIRFDNAFTTAGVCAPVRSATITGMYQNSIGTCPMRCKGVPPEQTRCFTEYLRAAGYYCSNNVKTDYQFEDPSGAWDDCSGKAHWRNRPDGKPFFSVINFTSTHESRIRIPKGRKAKIHDPAKANVPPYYPDTPLVRNDLACYADNITKMDKQTADVLRQLREDGLAEDTIVWFWGDHGRGLPRCKRWIYDSGLRVPLIIRVPKKFRKLTNPNEPGALAGGTVNDELVSFVDFAPTMLSLAGVEIPDYLQGQAFFGPQKARQREYVFGARDRIDDAPDIVRSVHDKHFVYVRNFMWYLTYAQTINYMELMPTMREMRRLHAQGKLKGAEKLYFRPTRPIEELYDLRSDPHEINNLADNAKYKDVLNRMRKTLRKWMMDIGDVGLIPEPDFDEMKRPGDKYETTTRPGFVNLSGSDTGKENMIKISCATAGASIVYRTDGKKGKAGWKLYSGPVQLEHGQTLSAKAARLGFRDSNVVEYKIGDQILAPQPALPAEPRWKDNLANTDMLEQLWAIKALDIEGTAAVPDYIKALDNKHAPVRYWAILALHNLGKDAKRIERLKNRFVKLLNDRSQSVRIAAAHALCDWGLEAKGVPVLVDVLRNANASGRHFAMVALEQIGEKARPVLGVIKASLKDGYAGRVATRIITKLNK